MIAFAGRAFAWWVVLRWIGRPAPKPWWQGTYYYTVTAIGTEGRTVATSAPTVLLDFDGPMPQQEMDRIKADFARAYS